LRLQEREVLQDLFLAGTGCQQIENVLHTNPQATDAGLSCTRLGIDCDALWLHRSDQ
jgi:hypothetical protein